MSLVPFVSTPKFEDYRERFKDHFRLDRRAGGLERDGDPLVQGDDVRGKALRRSHWPPSAAYRPSVMRMDSACQVPS